MWPVSGEAGGSEPDLQAQNQAQCVQQDSPMHGEPAASRHSHGGHYMHLCPEGGGWARLGPAYTVTLCQQTEGAEKPTQVMQIPTTKQDVIPLCLIQSMKSGVSCSGL